jgi:hypothetical protein
MNAAKTTPQSFFSIRVLLKIIVGFIATAVIAGIVLLLALPALLSSDFARQKIESYLSQELEKPVSIEAISFSWGEGLAVSNFTSVNRDQTPFVNLAALKLLLSWSSLLSGKLDIVTLDIKGIDVTVTRDKEGKTTVSDMLEAPAQEVSPEKESTSSAVSLPDLFLNARIEDGNFSFIDERLNTVTRIRSLHADLAIPSLREPLNVSLKGDVILNDNPPESIELSGTAHFAPEGDVDLQKGAGSLEMKAGFGNVNLFFDLAQMKTSREATGARFSCTLDLKKLAQLAAAVVGLPPGFSVKGSLKSGFETRGNIEKLVAIEGKTELINLSVAGGPLQNATFAQPRITFSHDIVLNFDTEVVDITSIALKSGFLDLFLSGAVKDFQENPSGKLLASGNGTLNDIVLVFGKILSLPPDLKLSGDVNFSLNAEGDLNKVGLKGTADCKNLEVNAAFLNNYPFREKALKLTPDVVLTLGEKTTGVAINTLNIQSEVVSGDLKGTLDSETAVDLTARLSTRLSLLKSNLRGIVPDSFPGEGQLLSDLTIKGNLNQSLTLKGNHTLDGAKIVLPPAPGEQSASTATTFSFPKLTVVHDADYQGEKDRIALKSLQVDSSFGKITGTGTLSRISKDLLTKAEAELSLDMPGVQKLIKDLLPEGLTMKGKGNITFAGEGSLSPPDGQPLLASWNGNGSLLVEGVDYAGLGSIQNLQSKNLSLVKGVLDTTLECLLNNGPSRVEGTVDLSKEKPDMKVTVEAKDVVLSQDLTLLGYIVPIMINSSEGHLSGKGDFSTQATWQGFSWDSEISKTIKGEGMLSLREGTLKSQNVLSQILKASRQPEVFQFEQILTGFRLSDGKIYNDDIQVNGKDVDLNIKGWTSLAYVPSQKGNPLEYSVAGDLIERSLGRDAKKIFSALGGAEGSIPIAIGGTVQKPRVVIKMPKAQDLIRGLFNIPKKKQ